MERLWFVGIRLISLFLVGMWLDTSVGVANPRTISDYLYVGLSASDVTDVHP